jgi:hypothetical protein
MAGGKGNKRGFKKAMTKRKSSARDRKTNTETAMVVGERNKSEILRKRKQTRFKVEERKGRGREIASENTTSRVVKGGKKVKIRGGNKREPSGASIGEERANKRDVETGKRL